MTNQPFNQRLYFDTEMSLSGPFTGVPQLIGILQNEPVMLLIKNQTNLTVFFADNSGGVKGTTMVAGESIVLDCRANAGKAVNMGFPSGTPFFLTATGGSGAFKVAVLYAQ